MTPRPADDFSTARVGMVGAGQLARMTQRAAIDLGVHLEVLARRGDDPGVLIGMPHRVGDWEDLDDLRSLAEDVEVLTLDHELAPNEHLQQLAAAGHVLRPSPDAVRFGQDKLHQRRTLRDMGFPVPPFAAAPDVPAVAGFADQHGWPVVLKARRGGYDGRGVVVAASETEVADVLGPGHTEWYVEALVDLDREVAVLGARRPSGQQETYPVIETVQRDGILVELLLPAPIDDDLAARARDLGQEIVAKIDATGVVAVELFVTTDHELLVNELALRPHNSGHATIEASATSQFHNHLRAVLDWPLGDTAMAAPAAALTNLLGGDEPVDLRATVADALAVPGVHLHLYGKEQRPGRKIGHVTALADDLELARANANEAAERLMQP
ncbi:MAG: 5-(carboxyamino)imidazole ribonucleotide synthase [Nitriliruptorales bacterium]|nr:5-(carboxyamino)imidazole ribonucleotide synthase [Nitriliruptorales bacterium]